MKLTPQQYAQALHNALEDSNPKDHDLIMDNFVKILSQNADLEKYSEIEVEYKKIIRKSDGITEAEVTVARELEINSGLMHQLNNIVGTKLEIKKKMDAGIVGGIILRVDDTLLDASVKTQINNLKQGLKS